MADAASAQRPNLWEGGDIGNYNKKGTRGGSTYLKHFSSEMVAPSLYTLVWKIFALFTLQAVIVVIFHFCNVFDPDVPLWLYLTIPPISGVVGKRPSLSLLSLSTML